MPPKINQLFPYTELERVTFPDGKRYYVDEDGIKLSSVTTIISATSDNTALDAWRERVGNKEADRVVTEACNLGTLFHTHLENYILQVERPTGSNLIRKISKKMSDQVIEKGLIHVNEVWGLEKSLWVPGAYAGTADVIGVHKGKPAIMDYKTARKMKSKDSIGHYFCQAAAYAIAHNYLYDTNIAKGVIFMVDRDFQYREFVIEGNEFEKAKEAWLKRLEVFLENKEKLGFK